MIPGCRPPALALALALAILLTGCSGSDGDPEDDPGSTSASPAALPPSIESTWSVDVPGLSATGELAGALLRTDDTVVVRADRRYVGIDIATGELRWSHRLPGEVCAASTAVPRDVAAYVAGPKCTELVAVDLTTGKAVWRREFPRQNQGGVSLKVEVGDRTVTLRGSCDQILRFSLKGGRPLGVLAPIDRVCGNETDTDGQLIAIWHDPETASTPDDRGTGWIPPYDGAGALELYDADTGRLLWRRTADRRGSGLNGLVSGGNPLILDTTSRGHELMQIFDRRTGEPGEYVGLRLTRPDDFTRHGVADGVLVGGYGNGLVAYDLSDGGELWATGGGSDGATEWVAGVDEHGVLVAARRHPELDDRIQSVAWLSRRDLRDGSDLGVLGWIPDGLDSVVVGDSLIVLGQQDMTAYPLPEPDPELVVPESNLPSVEGWEDGDIRPEATADRCPVTTSTLAHMGFRSVGLPEPANCRWAEHYQPEYVDRTLDVSLSVLPPGYEETAAEAAEAVVEQWVDQHRDHDHVWYQRSDPQRVTGLGDEAWVVSDAATDRRWAQTDLVVRAGNAVVTVEASIEAQVETRRAAAAPPHAVEEAALLAARDALSSLEIDVEEPERAADGPVDRASPVCRLLATDAAALVPGVRPVDLTPDRSSDPGRRASGCAWRGGGYQPELYVSVLAVPGTSLTGRSGVEEAERLVGRPDKDDRRVRGLGDRALLDSFTFEKGRSRTETITVREDNLVVVVEYGAWDQYSLADKARMDAAVTRIARKVLRVTS